MEEYDKLIESINSIEGLTPEQKAAMTSNAKSMNTELGVRGADLIKIKGDNESLKSKNQTYSEFADSLAKYNLKAEDVKKMADLAGIEQTHEDQKKELKDILLASQAESKELKTQLWQYKQEKELAPTIEKAIKDFVDAEGKPVELKTDFAKQAKDALYKGIKDGDDPVIINDRINKALLQAKTDQDEFLVRNGLTPANDSTHKVQTPPLGSASGKISTEGVQLAQKVMEDGRGSSESAAQAIMALRPKS